MRVGVWAVILEARLETDKRKTMRRCETTTMGLWTRSREGYGELFEAASSLGKGCLDKNGFLLEDSRIAVHEVGQRPKFVLVE